MKRIVGFVLLVLMSACQEDSSGNPFAGTQWVSKEPNKSDLDYWAFGEASALDYYEGFNDTTHCFEYTLFSYETDGDSVFLTTTGLDVRARYEFIGDSLRLYAFDGYIGLYKTSFMADTLTDCP